MRCKLRAMIDIITAAQCTEKYNNKKYDFEFMAGHLINLSFCLLAAQAVFSRIKEREREKEISSK